MQFTAVKTCQKLQGTKKFAFVMLTHRSINRYRFDKQVFFSSKMILVKCRNSFKQQISQFESNYQDLKPAVRSQQNMFFFLIVFDLL